MSPDVVRALSLCLFIPVLSILLSTPMFMPSPTQKPVNYTYLLYTNERNIYDIDEKVIQSLI